MDNKEQKICLYFKEFQQLLNALGEIKYKDVANIILFLQEIYKREIQEEKNLKSNNTNESNNKTRTN